MFFISKGIYALIILKQNKYLPIQSAKKDRQLANFLLLFNILTYSILTKKILFTLRLSIICICKSKYNTINNNHY